MYSRWVRLSATIALITVAFNEFIGDYFKLLECSWPKLPTHIENETEALNAMILADTHLLGPHGHWLDKLYREWHMHRAFQASMTLFKPEIVFILGDLFDEGNNIEDDVYMEHVERFRKHFKLPNETRLISAVGNHDVGFHYMMHSFFTNRFEKSFNNSLVDLYTLKDVHFVVINSMAMENDGCYFCGKAQQKIKEISSKLECLKNIETCKDKKVLEEHKSYSRPILMQHFPTYRISDKVCKEYDAPIITKNRENWEVLSKESTDLLGNQLQPRVAFSGHSHDYCLSTNRMGIEEYTAASFSWRNKINPSFFLARFTASSYAVAKCDMLTQTLVYNIYRAAVVVCITLMLIKLWPKVFRTL